MSSILNAFLEHDAAIRRVLRRLLPRSQDIEDLTQETFLRAFRAAPDGAVRAPGAFLFRIARNLALNERAKWSNSRTYFLEELIEPAVLDSENGSAPDEEVLARERLQLLRRAVAALPPQCRRVFVLRKIHGLSQREVAERLGISMSTVEKHVASGLVKCTAYLRREGSAVASRRIAAQAQGAPPPEPETRARAMRRVRPLQKRIDD